MVWSRFDRDRFEAYVLQAIYFGLAVSVGETEGFHYVQPFNLHLPL